ncbi:MAG: hypothetical protein Q8Q01_00375 [archaeon]|nr:hypothetical protein [archaeon]
MVKLVRVEMLNKSKLECTVKAIGLLMKDLLDLRDEINPIIHSMGTSKHAAKLIPNESRVNQIRTLFANTELHSRNMQKFAKETIASLEVSLAEL